MEPKQQHTPSVIAKLMGLEPTKALQKQPRVLSQNYMHKVASLASPQKAPLNRHPSFRLTAADEHEDTRKQKKGVLRKFENLSVQVNENEISASNVTPGVLVLPSSPVFSCLKGKCKSSFYRSVGSFLETEDKKQTLSEKWKMTKNHNVQNTHKRKSLAQMSKTSSIKCREQDLSNLILPVDKDVDLKDEAIRSTKGGPSYRASHNKRYLGPVQHTSRIRISHNKVGLRKSGSSNMKPQPVESNNGVGNNVMDDKLSGKQNYALPFGNHKDNQFETESISTGANDDFSQISDNLIHQGTLVGNYEEGSVSSIFGTDSDSLMNIEDYKESYQPSPISVLEPFPKEDISADLQQQIDFLNLELSETYSDDYSPGLREQLDFLNSEFSETYLAGSGMIVSSDEESSVERFNDNLEETENMMSLCKVEESRDFSYIMDVLHKAGYPDTGFKSWNSPEHAINPLVFEKLEKKYGEQKCWKRSERKLLFDRINLGLMDICQLPLGTNPLSRKLGLKQNLEEELWLLLEKEVSKHSPNQNVFTKEDKWLDLRDDIEAIGREIECCLIDELAAEFFSVE
ncbi:hypothetical protein ACFE04_003905 [Oxalis oulophora]